MKKNASPFLPPPTYFSFCSILCISPPAPALPFSPSLPLDSLALPTFARPPALPACFGGVPPPQPPARCLLFQLTPSSGSLSS